MAGADRGALPAAAIFDLDGTLVDSYGAIAESLNAARRAFALAPLPEDDVRRRVGHGLEALMADVLGAERAAEGVRRFRARYAEIYLDRTVALPGVADALDRLAGAGLPMAVASNKPARFTGPILERLGLRSAFRAVHGPDTVGATKPDPAMLRACLADLGARAAESVYVGDMTLDVESGRAAGVEVWLVPGGSSPARALRESGCPVLDGLGAVADRILRGPA